VVVIRLGSAVELSTCLMSVCSLFLVIRDRASVRLCLTVRATDFVEGQVAHEHKGSTGDANRSQLLFDSVLLSSEPKFSLYKRATVTSVVSSVVIDSTGADDGVTSAKYKNVVAAFPKLNFLPGADQTVVALCAIHGKFHIVLLLSIRYLIWYLDSCSFQLPKSISTWRDQGE
jgi:hypothetical protein